MKIKVFLKISRNFAVIAMVFFLLSCHKKQDPVTVKSNQSNILSFSITTTSGTVSALIDTTLRTILIKFPYNTTSFTLSPTITLSSNATVSPVSGAQQDFSGNVSYLVTAEDGSTKTYTVKMLVLPKPSVDFLVLGDWGFGNQLSPTYQQNVADQMNKTATSINSDFVMTVGDNFYLYGVSSTTDPIWNTAFESIYTGAALQKPWYACLGNHDYTGTAVPQAQVDYSKISKRWTMPARYYAFTKPLTDTDSVLFVCLDETPMVQTYANYADASSQDTLKQLSWFENVLKQSTARWKIVYGHYPIYSSGIHGNTPEMLQTIKPLLDKYNVDAYICGHDHDLEYLKSGTTDYIVSGGGAEGRPLLPIKSQYSIAANTMPGFFTVHVTADSLNLKMIDYNGNILYQSGRKHL